jgi:hypothetical protein
MKRGYHDAFLMQFSQGIDEFKRTRLDIKDESQFLLPPLSSLLGSLPQQTYPQQQSPLQQKPYYQQGPPIDPFRRPSFAEEIFVQQNHSQGAYAQQAPTQASYPTTVFKYEMASEILTKQQYAPSNQPQQVKQAVQKHVVRHSPQDYDSSSDDDSVDSHDSTHIPPIENPNFNYQQLQPIRILAYQVGLSRDPNKSWRYRDIKRALFEKSSKDQLALVDSDSNQALLRQRLPHKLSLAQFCKRLMLLVYHFIIRDGREPKFWRKKTVRQDLVKKILQECEPEFYKKVNIKVAVLLHSYVSAGLTISDAMERIEKEGKMNAQ